MTRYDIFRKRVAPLLFLGVLGMIAFDSCQKQERARATIVFDLGEAAPNVTAIDAELTFKGEQIGVFHRAAPPGGSIGVVKFDAVMPADQTEIRIDVTLRDKLRTITKTLRPVEGSTLTVPLGDALR